MSTPFSVSNPGIAGTPATNSPARRFSFPDWMREPLFHFLVVGFVLFAIDQFIVGRADDPRTIVVSADIDNEAKQVFKAARGHEPNAEELEALRRVWLDNEVLYREGLAQQVDKGDSAIRERVIFKALSVIDANVKLPEIDDKALNEWFEAHRVKYDVPARYDFQEAVLSGDTSEAAVRAFVDALNAGTPGDARAGLRIFKGRPHANLVQSYGADFTKALEAAPIGEWRTFKATDGWHAMQLISTAAAQPADYQTLRNTVMQDWRDAVASEQRTAAVRALAKKYKVKYEESRAQAAEGAAK